MDSREIIISKGSRCEFLGEHGCSLPYGLKPFRCRMYPLIYFSDGTLGVDSGCRLGEEYVRELMAGDVEAKEHFMEILGHLSALPDEDLKALSEESTWKSEYIKILINNK